MLEQKRIYLALPVEQIQIPMYGTAEAQLTENLRDLWSIEFDIDKYMDGELNPCYKYILPLSQIQVGGIGWFILQVPPEEQDDGNRIHKSFTAVGIEAQLQQENVTDLYINTGDELSREQYEENLDAYGVIIRNGRLYIPNESDNKTSDNYWELGLLNILEHEHLSKKGWTIGHVDPTLAAKRGRTFSFSTTNTYAILTQDIPKAFKCLPIFDRENKTVNFYEISHVGKEYNIEFSFRNFLNDVARVNQKDEFYTQLRVAGGNDRTSIAPYNFGSEYVDDFTYMIEEGVIDSTLAAKIQAYNTYRDGRRQDYLDAYNNIANTQADIDRIVDLHPIDAVRTSWNAYTVEELEEERAKWSLIATAIVNQHGTDDLPPYDPDYIILKSIRLVIIPDIDKEIERQNTGSQTNFEHINYKIIWELYGTAELEISKKSYENSRRSLAAKGYDHPWHEGDTDDQGSHDRNYQTYVTYGQYIDQINARLTYLNGIISDKQTALNNYQSARNAIANDVNIGNPRFGFNNVDLTFLNYLRIDCDYKDSSIEVIDGNDYEEVSECAIELYNSAKEQAAIVSRPQRRYEFSTDNPFLDDSAAEQLNGLTVGDFLYFELDNVEKLKQRVVSLSYNIADMNDITYSISMSDMTTLWGAADDWRFLLDTSSGVSASSIQNNSANKQQISNIAYSAASELLENFIGGGGGGNVLVAGLSDEEILILADKLSGLVQGTIDLDTLYAKFATIEQLQAEHIYAGTIEAALASFRTTVTNRLVADEADIGTLNADVANIGSLLSGNAGVGTLTAIRLTADNTVISNALIKDAMIDTISANKLTSGTVNTNNVTISSSDGGIQISGNTQQWTDGNGVVRMQAGQDAQGNFNYAIFGTDGQTVYIDENGIHNDAVPNQLIVNRMVSDVANISASKLNIESLFGVINNDQTHTLNSSKIWVDADNQSLGAKLDSMTTDISGNTSDISTLSSEYTVLNGQVSATMTKTDELDDALTTLSTDVTAQIGSITTSLNSVTATVNTHTGEISSLSTQTSTLRQDLTGFETTVSETYQTLDDAADDFDTLTTNYQSAISQMASSITLSVSNNSDNSVITISGDGITTQSETITFTGGVVFTNNLTDGVTTISGGNITTGIIKDAYNYNYWNLQTGELHMMALDNLKIGARNYIRKSNTLDYSGYGWI